MQSAKLRAAGSVGSSTSGRRENSARPTPGAERPEQPLRAEQRSPCPRVPGRDARREGCPQGGMPAGRDPRREGCPHVLTTCTGQAGSSSSVKEMTAGMRTQRPHGEAAHSGRGPSGELSQQPPGALSPQTPPPRGRAGRPRAGRTHCRAQVCEGCEPQGRQELLLTVTLFTYCCQCGASVAPGLPPAGRAGAASRRDAGASPAVSTGPGTRAPAAAAVGCCPGSGALAHRLSCGGARVWLLRATWFLPGSGIKSASAAPAGGFFTSEPPGTP